AMFGALGTAMMATLEEPIERVAQPTPPSRAVDPLVAAADKLMTDFCADFGGLETAMNVVRQQFEKAKVDVRAPTKEGLLKVIDYLSEVEKSVKPAPVVTANRVKRITWVKAVP